MGFWAAHPRSAITEFEDTRGVCIPQALAGGAGSEDVWRGPVPARPNRGQPSTESSMLPDGKPSPALMQEIRRRELSAASLYLGLRAFSSALLYCSPLLSMLAVLTMMHLQETWGWYCILGLMYRPGNRTYLVGARSTGLSMFCQRGGRDALVRICSPTVVCKISHRKFLAPGRVAYRSLPSKQTNYDLQP